MNRCLGLMLATIASLPLAGCGDRETNSGPMASETRDVAAFGAVAMEGAARLEITVGAPHSLVIEARESALKRVDTEVRGGTLYIKSRPRDWFVTEGRPRITVKVSAPTLESLKVAGGNDVRLTGFDGGETRIRAEGAAHIKAKGRVDQLTVQMAGAGHADLTDLQAAQANVTVDGVGSVYVHPIETLDATMNGVGAILYTGNPREVNTRMNGLGAIGRRSESDIDIEINTDDEQPTPAAPDPETLQPEYEDAQADKPKYTGGSTEVI